MDETTKSPKPDVTPNVSNPLGDDRFAALFTNPDFEVDESSEDFQLLHPVLAHRERRKEKQKSRQQVEKIDNVEVGVYVFVCPSTSIVCDVSLLLFMLLNVSITMYM